jgi:hypothetical protein
MKLTIVGVLAIVGTAIVTGPAFGSESTPFAPQQQPQHALRLASGSSYSAFPEVVRTMNEWQRASTAQPSQHVQVTPSYSAFPEVVRTMNDTSAANTQVLASSSDGFSWSDAGIGFAIGIGVLCFLGFLFVGIRRSKAPPVPA